MSNLSHHLLLWRAVLVSTHFAAITNAFLPFRSSATVVSCKLGVITSLFSHLH